MLNFPYIFTGETISFSDNGYFLYPPVVKIPANVSVINGAEAAFRGHTEIESVYFDAGSQLTTIAYQAFSGCTGLKSIVFPPDKTLSLPGQAFANDRELEQVSFPGGSLSIGSAPMCFLNCAKLSQESFAELMRQATGTVISSQMFNGCQAITALSVPDAMTQIATYAFSGCTALAEADINNVTALQTGAFLGCTALEEIEMNNVVSIQGSVFSGDTALKKVTFGKIITSGVGYLTATNNTHILYGCTALEDVVLPQGWNINLLLSNTNVLTHDSMVAMIDALYDYTGGTAHTLTLGATNLARLSASEQAVATAKNWTLT